MQKHFLEKFQELETFGAFALTPSFHPLLTHDFQPEKNLLRSIVWRNCCLRRGSRERGEGRKGLASLPLLPLSSTKLPVTFASFQAKEQQQKQEFYYYTKRRKKYNFPG